MITNKFNYPTMTRQSEQGVRYYNTPDGKKAPSVTSILKKTKDPEDEAGLQRWRDRVGEKEAHRVTNEAADRGSCMHDYLEEYCITDQMVKKSKRSMKPRQYTLDAHGYRMAEVVVREGLKDLSECWGTEVPLCYPEIYAGATDGIGVFTGDDVIFDFKQSNKPKKRSYIEDYCHQVAAYGIAHNNTYGTKIRKGVILICTQNLQFQKFIIEGNEWDHYVDSWWRKIEQYYDI